ncbi:hypothetical protein CPU09_14110 [Mammaliicoccus sciuri]|uniref:DsbA family protein n=1 Tax=Mammaliicoccus sciuri TaxID=1296 RepID=UPI000BBE9CC9|nr:thioredoxin domain-containing protein [Mammaliicoccus sciuri]PCM40010.1 hypothetical protein CPU09_14110 [Mammaliicoccus sciuri]
MTNKNSNSNIMFLMIATLIIVICIVLLIFESISENKENVLFAKTINAPEEYWYFHRALFEAETDDECLDLKVVQKAVDGLDINKSKKDQIMKLVKDRNSVSYKQMENDSDLTIKYNVDVTPTIVVDGKILSNPMDYDKVFKAIDQAIEKKNK